MSRLQHRLGGVWSASIERRAGSLRQTIARLDALSPLKVLARGYAIATRDDGRAVTSHDDVRAGDAVHVRVRDAIIHASVASVEPIATTSAAAEGHE